MRWIVATGILLVLGACSSTAMNKAECKTADWRAVGYEDGARGRSADAFGARRKACAEHGVAANFDAYLGGHGEGPAMFCRPQNGYRLGSNGYRYSGACPAHLEDGFRTAHADGYGLYERRRARDGIARELQRSKRRSSQIEHLLVEKTAQLASPMLMPAQRASIAVEIKQLAEEKASMNQHIRQLEYDHSVASHDYEAYRSQVASRYRG